MKFTLVLSEAPQRDKVSLCRGEVEAHVSAGAQEQKDSQWFPRELPTESQRQKCRLQVRMAVERSLTGAALAYFAGGRGEGK